jgi:SAM-dependent methyltransferase
MDAESLSFADASFDAVVNTYELMFCENPALAIREAFRVLVPRGRLVIVVWGDRARSPFFNVIGDVAARLLSLTPPDPSAPGGPWRFAAPGPLESLLEGGGFADVRVESCTMRFELASADDYVRVFSEVAWKSQLQALTREEFARFRDAVASAADPYVDGTRLRLPTVSRCASARKPQRPIRS